jgi:hypothetical protein
MGTMRIEASPRLAAGNLHRKDDNFLDMRSLTPQQATGNALAYSVQSAVQLLGLLKHDPGVFVKSEKIDFSVIPAKAGIQYFRYVLDSGIRRSDKVQDFLRGHQ